MSRPKGRGNFWRGNLDDLQRLLEGGIRKNELEEAIKAMPSMEKLKILVRLHEAKPTRSASEVSARKAN